MHTIAADPHSWTRCLRLMLVQPGLMAFLWAASGLSGEAAEVPAPNLERGAQVYAELCASCHGAAGEGGTQSYAQPLTGDKSVLELSSYIDRTMPEGEPEKCDAVDSLHVAAFIHDAFYSPIAQLRRSPPRVELSRLTVRQFRETTTDLVGSFMWGEEPAREQGLRTRIYKKQWADDEALAKDRVDTVIQYDFGEQAPLPEPEAGMDASTFSLRWTGTVLPPETGDYEFIIRSANGVRLWINDDAEALIEGTVRSGTDVELRARQFLLGGRQYHLRMEMFKSKEAKEKHAAIALHWRRPGHQEELIPARFLSPQWTGDKFIPSTPFPPDDRSVGYDRGTFVSPEWDQAVTDAAIATADFVAKHRLRFADTKPDDVERRAKLQKFAAEFVTRAFRRPLDDETRQRHVERHFAEGIDDEVAIKRVVLAALKSPKFLYREAAADPTDPWSVANALSFALWDSQPDQALREAAANNGLHEVGQVRWHAERMSLDRRAKAKLRNFLSTWLRLDHLTDIAKDSTLFADFSPELRDDLRTSLEMTLDDFVGAEPPALGQLLLDDHVWMNSRLATFYHAPTVPEGTWQKVQLDGGRRLGVVCHPFLMAGFAYTGSTSPIHRGVFVTRGILGRVLKAPAMAVAPEPASLHPGLTTRERVAFQTGAEACQSCHSLINPVGFAFEQFDAVGRWRDVDQDKPVDSTGRYVTQDGTAQDFANTSDLARYLAASREVHEAFAQQLFHALVKQPLPAFGLDQKAKLADRFEASGLNVRQLMIDAALLAAWPEAPPRKTNVAQR